MVDNMTAMQRKSGLGNFRGQNGLLMNVDGPGVTWKPSLLHLFRYFHLLVATVGFQSLNVVATSEINTFAELQSCIRNLYGHTFKFTITSAEAY